MQNFRSLWNFSTISHTESAEGQPAKKKYWIYRLPSFLIHLSLLFLVVGEGIIGILSSESFLSIKKAEKKNHSFIVNKTVPLSANPSNITSSTEYRLLPFSVALKELTQENHPGTNLPKNYSSLIDIYSTEETYLLSALISINKPFRYGGLTFYQVGFSENDEESVLKIIENPFPYIPYICSCLIVVGLICHFSMRIFFLKPKP